MTIKQYNELKEEIWNKARASEIQSALNWLEHTTISREAFINILKAELKDLEDED